MWVARSLEFNRLVLFQKKPEKHLNIYGDFIPHWVTDGFCMEIDSDLFPNLTWEDEPIEVEISVVNSTTCISCGKRYTYHDSDVIDESEPERENFWVYTVCPHCGNPNSI